MACFFSDNIVLFLLTIYVYAIKILQFHSQINTPTCILFSLWRMKFEFYRYFIGLIDSFDFQPLCVKHAVSNEARNPFDSFNPHHKLIHHKILKSPIKRVLLKIFWNKLFYRLAELFDFHFNLYLKLFWCYKISIKPHLYTVWVCCCSLVWI